VKAEEGWANIRRKKLREIGKEANDLKRVILQAEEFISGFQ